ncbi:Antitoxin of toxin-antitoxin stability system [Mycobacteroides abscessus subsp. bolletii]|uniref:type II toxin-antitoxin system prevent-host-death family antitoxin n=1 Tax=Mycobacteroides abscessus TaxID=36809 RepID=UPI00092877F8|nr:type II toxin-antitoxin system prevent-host-death family antitoxin [Mycobacteroides abscessus]SHQ49305.1 Antitoxin of toxin-antitoxin stability system [Mycobacteroides abscessus subsp. bolletii]SHR50836.1 Antitoxin of toxin-antitoxin stability system [Mycobacteroides abscessus subsp. bolletii]SHS33989.1 Antitoxin of toxin-antitoxin stability system [Mycobacteroides abscessus subsp. bolletii]SHT01970.1 Antitoxin of toxin-antitoxin stability system [Mycobacteroides abscessus subsp. bolletii]S
MGIADRLVSATELNRNSSGVLARAGAGARLVVVKDNRPVAAIVPVEDLDRLEDDGRGPYATPYRLDRLTPDRGKTLIGQMVSGELVKLPIAAHTLIDGENGFGRTATLSALLGGAWLNARLRLIIGTSKLEPPHMMHTDGLVTLGVAGICVDIDAEPNGAIFAGTIDSVIEQRRNRFREAGVATITEYRELYPDSSDKNSDVIVIIEEPTADSASVVGNLIMSLLDNGAELGIYLWLISPHEAAHASFTQRITHRIVNYNTAQTAAYSTKAKWLHAGEAVLTTHNQDGSTTDPKRFQIAAPDTRPYLIGAQPQGNKYGNLQYTAVAWT